MLERRQYERVIFLCKVTLTALPGGAPLDGQSVDLSLGGVGILTHASLLPGQLIRVSFALKNARQEKVVDEVIGRVAHLRADENGNRVGIEFLNPLQEAEHSALVQKLLKV